MQATMGRARPWVAALATVVAVMSLSTATMARSVAQFSDTAGPVTADAWAGHTTLELGDTTNLAGFTFSRGGIGPGWTDSFTVETVNLSTVQEPTDLTDIRLTTDGVSAGSALAQETQVIVDRDGLVAYDGTWAELLDLTSWDSAAATEWRSTNMPATPEQALWTFTFSLPSDPAQDVSGSDAAVNFVFEARQVVTWPYTNFQVQSTSYNLIDWLPGTSTFTVDAGTGFVQGTADGAYSLNDGSWVAHQFDMASTSIGVAGLPAVAGDHVQLRIPDGLGGFDHTNVFEIPAS